MIIQKLGLTNFRGVGRKDYSFNPGWNLIVGENGSGKTSIIDAIRVLLAQILPQFVGTPTNTLSFSLDDIKSGRKNAIIEIDGKCFDKDFSYTVHAINDDGGLRLDKHSSGFPAKRRTDGIRPLALYFSVRRAITTNNNERAEKKYPEYSECFFAKRSFKIGDLADWWRVAESNIIENSSSQSGNSLLIVKQALESLLPEFSNWRMLDRDLWADKKIVEKTLNEVSGEFESQDGYHALRIEQLSDGERNIAIIGFEISRRLAVLNPGVANPCQEGAGVVLIDEIDLHLHPKWQRRIIEDLRRTFPKIQFICTTHSPFLIQSLRSGEELIVLDGQTIANLDNKSINDVAQGIMGVSNPLVSQRYEAMRGAAKYYLETLEEAKISPEKKLEAYKERLSRALDVFSDNPGVQAFLEMKRAAALKE